MEGATNGCMSVYLLTSSSIIHWTDGRRSLYVFFLFYLSLPVKGLPELGELREVDALAAVLVALADQGLGLALAHGAANLNHFEIQKFSFN